MVQDNKSPNPKELTDIKDAPGKGRLMCVDPGTRKIGVAVSDEMQMTVRPVELIVRRSWKNLLEKIVELIARYDARALVVGLPLGFEGGETEMSAEARDMARKFDLSLEIPVYLHDERLSTYTARGHLWKTGKEGDELRERLDAESAAVILSDFIETRNMIASRDA
ncbi:MAG: Holliday junction resolvase RuvX [Acidobacteria bacterium]|nr:MAG: Holliday junction resolvase RuvX [Acidobacteriota bacterium]REK01349.1 MAG: Holliday junction resolvase RuvX [Acidobacteriota bacterium]REK14305.1 MAG: Holliday junction resolvase RuvX [Acidobacteriota bacterium]REK45020.1 MAG: Holliday junction resolvase RuvX [Acidobacteriota bacterium]